MRILLRKSDALKVYENVQRRLALALDLTPQAVNLWGRYVPELQARRLIDLHPELKEKAREAKPKRRAAAA